MPDPLQQFLKGGEKQDEKPKHQPTPLLPEGFQPEQPLIQLPSQQQPEAPTTGDGWSNIIRTLEQPLIEKTRIEKERLEKEARARKEAEEREDKRIRESYLSEEARQKKLLEDRRDKEIQGRFEADEKAAKAKLDENNRIGESEAGLRARAIRIASIPQPPKPKSDIPQNKPPRSRESFAKWEAAHLEFLRQARHVSDASTINERRSALVRFGNVYLDILNSNEFKQRQFDPSDPNDFTDEMRKAYSNVRNSSALNKSLGILKEWFKTGDAGDPAEEERAWLAEFNKSYDTRFKTKEEADAHVDKLAKVGEGMQKVRNIAPDLAIGAADVAFYPTALAAWPHSMVEIGEWAGVAVGETAEAASSVAHHVVGAEKAQDNQGKFLDAYLRSGSYGRGATAQQILEAEGVQGFARGAGQIGEMTPDILASMALTPAMQPALAQARLAMGANKYLMQSASGQRLLATQASSLAWGSTLGSKEFAITGDMDAALKAGVLGALFPPAHKMGVNAAGKITERVFRNYPDKLAMHSNKVKMAEEMAALGGIVAVIESPHFVERWRSADDETKRLLITESIGKLITLALPAALAARHKSTSRAEEISKERSKKKLTEEELELQRSKNEFEVFLRENPEFVDSFIKSLDDTLKSHKRLTPEEAKAEMDRIINEAVAEPKPLPEAEATIRPEMSDALSRKREADLESGKIDERAESILKGMDKFARRDKDLDAAAEIAAEMRKEAGYETKEEVTKRHYDAARERAANESIDRMVRESEARAAERAELEPLPEVTPRERPLEPWEERVREIEDTLEGWERSDAAHRSAVEVVRNGGSYKGLKGSDALRALHDNYRRLGRTEAEWADIINPKPETKPAEPKVEPEPKPEEPVAEAKPEKAPEAVEPELTESWQTTHEATGANNIMSKGIFDRYLEEGKMIANPDGSYTLTIGRKGRWVKSGKVDAEGNTLELLEIKPRAEEVVRGEAKIEEAAKEEKVTPEKVVEAEAKPKEAEAKETEPVEPPVEGEPPVSEPPPKATLSTDPADWADTRMRQAVKNEIGFLRELGDEETARDLEANPDNYYNVLPASKLHRMVQRMGREDVDAHLTEAEKPNSEASNIETLLQIRKQELLYDEMIAERDSGTGKTEAKQAYEDWTTVIAQEKTALGRLIQQMRYSRKVPSFALDILEKTLAADGKKPLTEAERKLFLENSEELRALEKEVEGFLSAAKKAEDPTAKEKFVENLIRAKERHSGLLDKQAAFLAEKNPMRWADLALAQLQGSYLTPTTLLINVAGNILPLPFRAAARTGARGLDFVADAILWVGRFEHRLETARERLKETERGTEEYRNLKEEIAGYEKLLSPEAQRRLSPIRGTMDKAKGFFYRGLGIERIGRVKKEMDAEFEWKEKGVKRLVEALRYGGEFRNKMKERSIDDALTALLFGQRLGINEYEVEAGKDFGSSIRSVNAIEAWGRLYRKAWVGKDYGTLGKDIAEGILGVPTDAMFRALAMGDLPFRHAEHMRVIREYGLTRTEMDKGILKPKPLSEAEIKLAQKAPEVFFDKATVDKMWNEASKATFQQENVATRWVRSINEMFDVDYVGPAYKMARGAYMPYQKTLMNISGEFFMFSPLGLPASIVQGKRYGWNSREFKYAAAQAAVGTMSYALAEHLMGRGILQVSPDATPGMSRADSKKVRYSMDMAFPHSSINLSALGRLLDGGRGDTWQEGDIVADTKRLGVLGNILNEAAAFKFRLEGLPEDERKRLESSPWARVQNSITSQATFTLNQSWAQGLRDFARGVQGLNHPDKDGMLAISRPFSRALPSLVLPNTLEWFYKRDSKFRQDFKPDSFFDETENALRKRLKMMGIGDGPDEAPLMVDLWGSPLPSHPARGVKGDLASDLLYQTFGLRSSGDNKVLAKGQWVQDPLSSEVKGQWIQDPVSNEAYRLFRKYRKTDVFMAPPSRYMRVGGQQYKLSKEQYNLYSRMLGNYRFSGTYRGWRKTHEGYSPQLFAGARELVLTDWWGSDSISDEQRMSVLASTFGKARTEAKKDFLSEVGIENLEKIDDPSGKYESISD